MQGVLDRFGQIEPKVLIACDGYWYNGKPIDYRAKVKAVAAKLPSLQQIVIVPVSRRRRRMPELPKGASCCREALPRYAGGR